jgi:hypothetical protein
VTEGEGAVGAREQGWRGPILALLLLVILPATPLLRILLPFEQSILLLVPVLAVLAVAGWRLGGRWPLALFWSVLAVWMLWQPGDRATAFDLLARGWVAILAATFGGLSMAGTGERFLPRALMAIGVSLAVSAFVAVIASGGAAGAVEVLAGEVSRRAALSTEQWRVMTSTEEWLGFVERNPNAKVLADGVDQQLASMPGFARRLFPALLALESLAAMALAWAAYHRLGRVRLGPPLARLQDLRFNDALVWGIIAGMVLVVLPAPGLVRTAGINLLVFFGALYALRGLGVMLWFLAPGRWMKVFLLLFTFLFWHVVGLVAVAIGIGDTWFDWRRRLRPKSQRSE